MKKHKEKSADAEKKEEAGTDARKTTIGVAIGEASMCWSETPKGVFDSTRATEIADNLYAELFPKVEAPKPSEDAISRDLTIGEYRVGVTFNPGGHPKVNEIKGLSAKFIDLSRTDCEAAKAAGAEFIEYCKGDEEEGSSKPEVARCFKIAIKSADAAIAALGDHVAAEEAMETAAMYAVKGATKPELPANLAV